jgi:hypothetical protein
MDRRQAVQFAFIHRFQTMTATAAPLSLFDQLAAVLAR